MEDEELLEMLTKNVSVYTKTREQCETDPKGMVHPGSIIIEENEERVFKYCPTCGATYYQENKVEEKSS